MSEDPADRLRELLATPWIRSRVLIHLAPGLPADTLPFVTHAARSLAYQFRGGERLAEPLLAAIAARAVELAELTGSLAVGWDVIAYVPDDVLPRAIELARAGEDADARVELAPRAARAGYPDIALALLEVAAAMAGSWAVRSALEEVAPQLGPAEGDRALDLALRTRSVDVVAALAPSLTLEQAQRAFAAVTALETQDGLAALAALAPQLGPERRAGAAHGVLASLAGLPAETVLHVATTLAEGLPEPERAGALRVAFDAADAAVGRRSAMEDLIRLAALTPTQEPVARAALERLQAFDPSDQAPLAVQLAAVVPPGDARDLALARAVDLAPSTAEPWRVLADVASLAPDPRRAEAERVAVTAAQAVGDDAERLVALEVVYERLPHLASQPSPAPGTYGVTVMDTVDEILAAVPPADRVALLTEALYHHVGPILMAPPPTAEPEPEPAPAPAVEAPSPGPGPPLPASGAEPAPAPSPHPPPAGAFPRWMPGPLLRYRAKSSGARAKRPVVNTGFARPRAPDDPLPPRRPLAPGRTYLFWLEVGAELARSIEARAVSLPRDLPEGARVAVVLSAVSDGVVVADAAGELEVGAGGSATVSRHAATVTSARPRRLFFRIHVKASRGEIAMRCSIYRHQVVVQSRLVRARVAGRLGRAVPRRAPALVSTLDYVLARTLDPPVLASVPEHTVSLMVNGDGTTHALQLVTAGSGAPDVRAATFEGGELQDLVTQTRGALRRAAWDTEDPWEEGLAYRYGGPLDGDRLERDLVRMAVRGYRFYDACINRLAGGYEDVAALEEKLRRPGRIQIANRRHAGLILPAAMFYDQPLDTGVATLGLCPEFRAALGAGTPLETTRCFTGDCPSHDHLDVVCPSGFWGFRHFLGIPLSLGEEPTDEAAVFEGIEVDGPAEISFAVSTDPMFVGRAEHEARLRALGPDLSWHYADTREETLRLLRDTPAHLVYFYCHGGLTATNVPYLTVGPHGEAGIPSDIFRAMRIRWIRPRPLVFINGCHTTALNPEQALNFPARLVENAAAAGVIGTEITNFEPLASAFAEECLRRFLGGEAIGEAVRGARLALLARGNPLGLIYVPFVLPSVRLVRR